MELGGKLSLLFRHYANQGRWKREKWAVWGYDRVGVWLYCVLTRLDFVFLFLGPRKDQLTAHRFYRVVQDMGLMGM